MNRIGSTWLAGAALAVIGTATAFPAMAQTAPAEGASADAATEILVTGSRIRRDPLDQAAPVVTLDSESIAKTGLSSIADVLQRLPSSAGGLNSKFNNSGNLGNPPDGGGVGAGSATIDLRYLGGKRTLVLVDGVRYVNGASASGIPASVDLNSIPEGMIERIEVLQSGASPLYGSDAIAGVVNIITKSKQKGFRASAQYGGFLGKGDGETQNYQMSWGTGKDGVSLVVGGSYVKQGSVSARDRSISQFPNPGQTSCSDPIGGCSSATPLGRFIAFGQNMTLRGPVVGRNAVYDPTLATGDFKAFTSADRFNFAPYNYFQTPSERYGGFINARAEFSDAITAKLTAVYNHRHSQNQAAFLPLFVGPDAGNGNLLDTIKIDATNPYNPFGVTLDSSNYSFIARRLVEAGQRTYTQDVDTFDVKGGFEGKFSLLGRNWFWDVTGVYGTNDARQLFTGNVNAAKLAQALGPISACTGDCVPFNIFGGVGSVTPAMLSFVGFDEHAKSGQALYDFQANLSGELFDLPGGPVGIAIGAEHRKQEGYFDPDPIIQAGLGADIPAQAARGGFKVDEVYGELRLPLLKDVPFFHYLELSGAARYSDYSTFGGNTTLTGSVQWKPVADFMLRGSYAESLRAPSIGELYGAQSRFDQPLSDPCTNVTGSLWQTSATAKANCIANGVPANGSYQEPQGGQLPVLTGGNPNLQPETARTILIGGVYSPDWADRKISLELNYYDIKLEGAVDSIGADVLLNRCALAGDALSCNAVKRTPSGFISSINGVLLNTGTIRTRGLDATLNLRSGETGAGAFSLAVYANFLFKYQVGVPSTDGVTTTNYTGTERGSPDQAYPRFKSTAVLDWTMGPVTTTLTGRYISGVKEIQDTTKKLASRFYTDVQVQYRPSFLDSRFALTLGVNNVFDVNPPACFSCSLNNYDPTTYDVPGQFGYLRLSYSL
ncbi:TonB-dependent receptor [Novosphingobium sp. KCTC 2891]|uniref:TonB-dependent receptor domain-containing protein n=1 Tax=Novosphingobium sp. KCTC 2891 TaxID=2989730 RepID=UPI0022224C2C|nr:TonB-dependent receptor [Novosphingobium sp. KCTC 2891]MCW1383329.1 TonB-dependent receptor [Novosphingobium sp. KCTC 2891]